MCVCVCVCVCVQIECDLPVHKLANWSEVGPHSFACTNPHHLHVTRALSNVILSSLPEVVASRAAFSQQGLDDAPATERIHWLAYKAVFSCETQSIIV